MPLNTRTPDAPGMPESRAASVLIGSRTVVRLARPELVEGRACSGSTARKPPTIASAAKIAPVALILWFGNRTFAMVLIFFPNTRDIANGIQKIFFRNRRGASCGGWRRGAATAPAYSADRRDQEGPRQPLRDSRCRWKHDGVRDARRRRARRHQTPEQRRADPEPGAHRHRQTGVDDH